MKICYLLFFRINKDINIILIQRLIINPRSGQPQQCVVKWPDNCSITPTLAALHTTHTPDIMSPTPGTVTPWTMTYIMHTLYKMVYLLSSFTLFDISGNIGRKASIYPNITSKGPVSTIHIPHDLHAVYFHVNFQILFKTVWLKCTYNTIFHSLIFKLFQYTQNKKYMLLNSDNTDAS